MFPLLKASLCRRTARAMGLFALLMPVGCRQQEEIRTYRIAKPEAESPPPPAAATPAETAPRDRMIAAILPGAEQAWFFKASGSKLVIDPLEAAIKDFLGQVQLSDGEPTWQLPEGWNERPGSGMRRATLLIPAAEGGSEVEMSVIGLGLSGDWDRQVLDNVNRWRGQLGLEPLAAGEADFQPLADGDDRAVLIDEQGVLQQNTMAPFAGRTKSTPPPAAPRPKQLTYQRPEGWVEDPEASPIRKASLTTPGGAAATAFVFPAVAQMAKPLDNANRWRQEIGLDPWDAEALLENSVAIQLLGEKAVYFQLVGAQESTTAAMVVLENQVWFFKLRGPGEEVVRQHEAFLEWVQSASL